ncbi:MAG: flavin prenyltransferase UbiX [Syntrophales bacterium]|nr:flavin prenyltransferase UbiX [Syntrophales bacterium]
MKKRITVGITGASGAVYAVRLLDVLLTMPLEIHLIVSAMGWDILRYEQEGDDETPDDFVTRKLRPKTTAGDLILHPIGDMFAPVASGSFQATGMVVVPCSMRTLSSIAAGHAGNLIERAADVTLKERRPLVLVPRETPLSLIHLRNMTAATEAGAVIMPASPPFYHRPREIADLVNFMAGRILDHLQLEHQLIPRWGEKHA